MEGYFMAQVMLFAGNFAPQNWMYCQGQILPIGQYDALFALLGTTFGGDGQTTFGLPDLRGRTPVGCSAQGPGLSNRTLGEMGGSNTVTLTANNLATHTHGGSTMTVPVSTANGNLNTPVNNVPANSASPIYATAAGATGHLGGVSGSSTNSGSSQPVDIMQPYLAMNFVICVYGIFPSRN